MKIDNWTIIKRDGRIQKFDENKVRGVIEKCFVNGLGRSHDEAIPMARRVAGMVVNLLSGTNDSQFDIERVQQAVISQLWADGQYEAAEHYTLYREERRKQREAKRISPELAELINSEAARFPTQIQAYQFYSKFARWREQDGRRETWSESNDRVFDWFSTLDCWPRLRLDEVTWLRRKMISFESSPAMRVVQMAGPALTRCNIGCYNCASTPIDDLQSFPELLYILMQGTGCGFSVESDFIDDLPRIKKQRRGGKSEMQRFAIPDDTEGWCEALRIGLETWFDGYDIDYDYSLIRPKNAKLKTKGGRSCLTGDTIVYKDKKKSVGANTLTIAELYEKRLKTPRRLKHIKIRCLDEATGTFQRNRVLDVIDNGIADVYEVVTENGYKIKATDNHRFMDESRTYKHLSLFSVGDHIAVNGATASAGVCEECGAATHKRSTRCKACFTANPTCLGCKTPLTNRASRCLSCREKTGQCACGERISRRAENCLACAYQASLKPDALPTTARGRKECQSANSGVCSICSRDDIDTEVHHKDKNPLNNSADNLLCLCEGCHSKLHAAEYTFGNPYAHRYMSFDRIVSITHVGRERVYDLCMEAPNHNFVANGFVSHNSGPEPLKQLLDFTRAMILNAQGRRLTDLECHDLCCKIGRIVQVGGVRRAACISLSDLNSKAMREAKHGPWWQSAPHRSMANNSSVYEFDGLPPAELFLEELTALVKSKSGERGIFSRTAARKQRPKRRKDARFVTNPCVPADTWVHTDEGARRLHSLIGKPFTAIVDGKPHRSTGFFETGTKQLYRLSLANGASVRATAEHRIMVVSSQTQTTQRTEWRELRDIRPGDHVVLHNHRGVYWTGLGTQDEGYLLGSLVGDGTMSEKTAYLDFWGDNRKHMADAVVGMLRNSVVIRGDSVGSEQIAAVGKRRVQSTGLHKLASEFGVTRERNFGDAIEEASHDFYVGFLRGWFDADGTVGGKQEKGVSVRLSSVNLEKLHRARRMLLRMGINSTIYANRKDAGMRMLPDGKGGLAEYPCQAIHELVIANDNIQEFARVVGFSDPDKKEKLAKLIDSYVRRPNRDRFCEKVVSIVEDGVEHVYDCAVPGPQSFDADGVYVHNCGEIILRPRGVCNLTIAIVRGHETEDEIADSLRAATYFGVIQSTATNFRYVRHEWRKNAEEERLLGVDLMGHLDHPRLRPGADGRKGLVERLKQVVAETAQELSARFGIAYSAANTCLKPGGDSGVFFHSCTLGGYPSPYQIRTTRERIDSPIVAMLRDQGVPVEQDEINPELAVVSWPRKNPDNCITEEGMGAIEQLENWFFWKTTWAEHSCSVTIHVKEHEWPAVIAWLYDKEHFDHATGLSFLPFDGHTYRQAPNQRITQQEFETLDGKFPKIDWSQLIRYEVEDSTTASAEPACTAGGCTT